MFLILIESCIRLLGIFNCELVVDVWVMVLGCLISDFILFSDLVRMKMWVLVYRFCVVC